MGKFDKFKPLGSGKPGSSNLPAAASSGGNHLRAQLIARGRSEGAPDHIAAHIQGSCNFAIALDATGSMADLIDTAKRSVEEIMNRLFKEAKTRIKIQFFVYRDYDVPNDVLETSSLSEDAQELIRWIAKVRAFGGGGNSGEAIHEALSAIQSSGPFAAVLLAGDEPPITSREFAALGKPNLRNAFQWATDFGAGKLPIHAFVVGNRPDTVRDFAEIARRSGGQSGRLDGSAGMRDMAVLAMLNALKGAEAVRSYMQKHSLNVGARDFGKLLLAGPKKP